MIPCPAGPKNAVYYALPVIVAGVLLCLWRASCEFPVYAWNEARLAPAFALRQGINPYPPLGGGPLSTWIYGPLGIVVNLPATFASTALGAVQAACLINLTVLITPLAWVFFRSRDLQKSNGAMRWFALGVAILLIPRPSLVLQIADHTAVAFGLFSCWFLTRSAHPSMFDLFSAAISGILAVWTKQIEVFLIAAQLVYLLLVTDRSAAVGYLSWLLGFGLLTLGVIIWYFGWSNLWLNLVVIPGRLPWTDDMAGRIAMRSWALVAQILVPCAALTWLRFTRHWPRGGSQGARFFLITIFVYFSMLPIGIAAFFKTGGDINLLHSWNYLLPGCLLGWLTPETISIRARVCWISALSVLCLCLRQADVFSYPTRPLTAHFAAADELIAAHPHRIWFPRNPVVNYYADKQLWHTEDGIETRFLANYGLREVDFRSYLPPGLEVIAYPANIENPFSMQLLREFSEKTFVPYWSVYRRPEIDP